MVQAVLTESRAVGYSVTHLSKPLWAAECPRLTPDHSIPVVGNRTPLLDEPAAAPGEAIEPVFQPESDQRVVERMPDRSRQLVRADPQLIRRLRLPPPQRPPDRL